MSPTVAAAQLVVVAWSFAVSALLALASIPPPAPPPVGWAPAVTDWALPGALPVGGAGRKLDETPVGGTPPGLPPPGTPPAVAAAYAPVPARPASTPPRATAATALPSRRGGTSKAAADTTVPARIAERSSGCQLALRASST